MNKQTTKQWVELLDNRSKTLTAKRIAMKADGCTLSKATKQTQTFALTKELKRISVIRELILNTTETYEPSKEISEFLVSITEPKSGTGVSVEVNKGDKFLDLIMNKYPDVKDAAAKIMKTAAKANLTMDPVTGVFA